MYFLAAYCPANNVWGMSSSVGWMHLIGNLQQERTSAVQLFQFSRTISFSFFNISESKNRQSRFLGKKYQNQVTINFGSFKNLKESVVFTEDWAGFVGGCLICFNTFENNRGYTSGSILWFFWEPWLWTLRITLINGGVCSCFW